MSYEQYAQLRLSGKHNIISSFFLIYPFLQNKKVLDIGCSDGLYLKCFSPDSVGIEQIVTLAEAARRQGMQVIQGDILDILLRIPSRSFPTVLFSHVMEHLESPILALREINRILEPNGFLVLGLPTENNLFRFVLRKDYFDGTHLYSFSVRNAIKLLKLAGFNPVKICYDLPKCHGRLGSLLIRFYQYFPFKEYISMAYWVVAGKG